MSILINPMARASCSAGVSPFSEALKLSVEAYELDDPACSEAFSGRLAREQGWTRECAERAIREYKRFVFLAVSDFGSAVPSDVVDQVWHQHLTYTRDYWGSFCAALLGRPLHHHPSAGGASALAAHRAAYSETLAAYQRVFGERPPSDIWPSPEIRFGTSSRFERVDVAAHFVVPRGRVLSMGFGMLLLSSTPWICVGQVATLRLLIASSALSFGAVLAAYVLSLFESWRARSTISFIGAGCGTISCGSCGCH